MTTKDQAIAPKVMLFNPYTGKPRFPLDIQSDPQGILIVDPEATSLRAYQPPAPDCRTCENLQHYRHCNNNHNSEVDCTNGDQYKPAPKVVLWRTE